MNTLNELELNEQGYIAPWHLSRGLTPETPVTAEAAGVNCVKVLRRGNSYVVLDVINTANDPMFPSRSDLEAFRYVGQRLSYISRGCLF